MATLREYFQKDSRVLTAHKELPLANAITNEIIITMIGRLHYDFEAGALYVSIYIPKTEEIECPARFALSNLDDIMKLKSEVFVIAKAPGDEATNINDLVFTGKIYIYDENEISDENKKYIDSKSKELGHTVIFRGNNYASERAKFEKPLAFISHDYRDKELIAKPIAIGLQKLLCPVWYDEFSLKVGDSLRDGIEKGLKECEKCILVLTKNFLSNEGWGKREYDSIFTRELVEKQKVILPVWHNITPKEIYQYSPILADRVGVNWELGEQEVIRKLYQAIIA